MSVEEPSLPASEESYTSNTLVWLCSCGLCVTLRAVELALLYQVGDAKVRTLYVAAPALEGSPARGFL